MGRVRPDATAFVGSRCALPHERSRPLVRSGRRRAGARLGAPDLQALAPHATGSGYVNFLTEDEGERVAASYGGNYPRLQALKRRFDPDNLFRMNLNIAPACGAYDGALAVSRVDHRGCAVSGADACRARGVRARARRLPGAGASAPTALALALQEAPALRDGARAAGLPARLQPRPAPRRARRARCSRAPPRCRANERERAPPRRDRRRCSTTTSTPPGAPRRRCSASQPRDALALQAAHSFDYVSGDVARLNERVAAVLPCLVDRPARLPRRPRHARLRPRGVRRPRRAEASRARRPRARSRSMRARTTSWRMSSR